METRRDFIESIPKRLGAIAGGAVMFKEGIAHAAARVVEAIGVCLDEKKGGRDSLLKKACTHTIEDPEKRLRIIESLRSSAAFEEMAPTLAKKIDLSRRTLSFLYPGAGSHIAPLALVFRLMEDDVIDNATCTLTEIDPCKVMELEENLRLLSEIIPGLTFENQVALESCGKEGVETTYNLTYKGKPITIRFAFQCTEKTDWFRDDDHTAADLYIQHDSAGPGPNHVTLVTLQNIYAASRNGTHILPTIMEDTTRMENFGDLSRGFDLELIGNFIRGSKPYGHRYPDSTTLALFSRLQACQAEEELQLNHFQGESVDDIPQWLEHGKAPDHYMDLTTETSKTADSRNPALLMPHEKLSALGPENIAVLIKISFTAKNTAAYEKKLLSDVVSNGEIICDAIASINPKLAEALALRVFQLFLKFEGELAEWVETNHPNDYETGYQIVHGILTHAGQYLGQRVQREVAPDLKTLTDYLENMRRYQYLYENKERSHRAYEDGPTEEENKTLADQLYQVYCVKAGLWEKHAIDRNKKKREKALRNLDELGDRLFEAIPKTA